MAQEARALCPTCNTEIVPGTIFCWQHSANPPRVAEFRADDGQLLWVTKDSKRLVERAVALVVNAEQVVVSDVVPLLDQKPACLRLYYREPSAATTLNEDDTVDIALSVLLERLLAGAELVDATRTSKTE